jgi:hypothetical protein
MAGNEGQEPPKLALRDDLPFISVLAVLKPAGKTLLGAEPDELSCNLVMSVDDLR